MKSLKINILGAMLILFLISTAGATTYTLSYLPNELGDLDQKWAYTWGIDWATPGGQAIVGASLLFDEFHNWKDEPNNLYVTLLDSAFRGVKTYWDNQAAGDYYSGTGLLLNQFQNVSNVAADTTYIFSGDELSVLKLYLADGNFGFGFDSDSLFWNNGIYLTIETAATPLPAPILLLGTGLIGMAGFRWRHGRNKA